MLGSCPAFPSTAIFNTRIDDPVRFPPLAASDAWVSAIGVTRALHADWGSTEDPASASYYGIPMNLLAAVSPETDWPTIAFTSDGAPDESDCASADGSGGFVGVPMADVAFDPNNETIVYVDGVPVSDAARGTRGARAG